jgi:hypothetical protein
MLARMRTVLFACAAALAACHSAPPAAAPSSAATQAGPMPTSAAAPLACGKVSDHLVSLMPNGQGAPQDAKDKLAGALSQACEQDAWSEAAKACLLGAATHDAAMDGCGDKLTRAQVDSAAQHVQTALGGAPAAANAPAPAAEAAPTAAEPAPPPPAGTKKSASKSRKAPGAANGDPDDGSE